MNGILLVTHGNVGQALIQCVEHVYGVCPEGIEVCAVQGVNAEAHARVQIAVDRIREQGDGVLILTDVYGASPSNIATKYVEPGAIAVLSGVNVPMLLRAISYRHEPLETVCQKALDGGVRGIVCTQSISHERECES